MKAQYDKRHIYLVTWGVGVLGITIYYNIPYYSKFKHLLIENEVTEVCKWDLMTSEYWEIKNAVILTQNTLTLLWSEWEKGGVLTKYSHSNLIFTIYKDINI